MQNLFVVLNQRTIGSGRWNYSSCSKHFNGFTNQIDVWHNMNVIPSVKDQSCISSCASGSREMTRLRPEISLPNKNGSKDDFVAGVSPNFHST